MRFVSHLRWFTGAIALSTFLVAPYALANGAGDSEGLARLEKASVKKGDGRAAICRACHKVIKGEQGGAGPNLWNVFYREKGVVDGFVYSDALKTAGGEWDVGSLDQFLKKPGKYIPGTKMTFGGIPSEKDRLNVIAYLRSLSDNP
ncbi:MAG: cytochrome c family protein [Motiliproteus sp.]